MTDATLSPADTGDGAVASSPARAGVYASAASSEDAGASSSRGMTKVTSMSERRFNVRTQRPVESSTRPISLEPRGSLWHTGAASQNNLSVSIPYELLVGLRY